MNATTPPSRRSLTARRVALMATTIAGFGAAAFFAPYAPKAGFFSAPAYAQNLTQQAQQLAQKPIGFADIVEKVKPAVISVRVKMERAAEAGPSSDELPFPPGSPFERFFKRFGMPNNGHGGGHEVITGQGSGFFIGAVETTHLVLVGTLAGAALVPCVEFIKLSGMLPSNRAYGPRHSVVGVNLDSGTRAASPRLQQDWSPLIP